jgi:hypothetical protein
VVAGLYGLCKLAVKLNLNDLEWAVAGLCKLRIQMVAVARLSMGSIMWTGMVLRAEVAIRVACCHQKTTHWHLSCIYVAGDGRCQCYIGLNACGMSITVVHFVYA